MIKKIYFKNIKSFSEGVTIDFEVNKKFHSNVSIIQNTNYLNSLFIYGPNNSGKTCLLEAIKLFYQIVNLSFYKGVPENIGFYFSANVPSEYEVEVVVNRMEYRYGFVLTDEIIEEYLYCKKDEKGSREKLVFERNKNKLKYGPSYKGAKKQVEMALKTTNLFLVVANHFNVAVVKELVEYLKTPYKTIGNINGDNPSLNLLLTLCDEEKSKKLIEKVNKFDILIKDIKVIKDDKFDIKSFLEKKINDELDEDIPDIGIKDNFFKTEVTLSNGEKDISVKLRNLSRGTIRLLNIFAIIDSEKDSQLYLIDELESGFHPLVVDELLKEILEANNSSQFIITTHNINLLSDLRKDQIILINKNLNLESEVVYLNEYKTRSDSNIESLFLNGAFGAIPFIESDDV